jgi:exo-1,4-beta-D-glucosaminidase
VTASATLESIDGKRIIRVHLANSNDALAFQLHAAIRTPKDELVAPVFWSDNWLELVPGESTTLTAEIPDNANDPVVVLDGWNIAPTKLQLIAAAR